MSRAGVASGAVRNGGEGHKSRRSRVDEETVIHLASRPDGSSAYVLRSQNGVRVSVNSGGVISRLDAALILETFVQAFLLLSFSNIVMRFVAFTLLGTKSRVHKEFGEHEVEYERDLEDGRTLTASLTPADKNLEVEVTDTKFESGATWTVKASVPLEGDNLIDDAKVSLTRAWSW